MRISPFQGMVEEKVFTVDRQREFSHRPLEEYGQNWATRGERVRERKRKGGREGRGKRREEREVDKESRPREKPRIKRTLGQKVRFIWDREDGEMEVEHSQV